MTTTERGADILAPGTAIDAYVVRSVLGAGGFGVTYLCEHRRLGKLFAVKEYFPRGFAQRHGNQVSAYTNAEPTYRWGLERFLQEARALARFQHRAIVSVSDVFEANGTAYIVLSYEQGRDMRAWLGQLGRAPSQDEIDAQLRDLLEALALLHASELLHRDIAPDNIYIRTDGTPVLLDFGAARHALREHSTQMSAIVKSGYSPPEQYTTQGKAQGPWSDIYAFGATLYALIAGKAPPEASLRMLGDTYVPVAEAVRGRYRPGFLAAIDHALVLAPERRPQSIEAWQQELFASEARPSVQRPEVVASSGPLRRAEVPAAGSDPLPKAASDGPDGPGKGSDPLAAADDGWGAAAPRVPDAAAASGRGPLVIVGVVALLVAGAAITAVSMRRSAAIAPNLTLTQPRPATALSGRSICDVLASVPLAGGARGVQPEAMDRGRAVGECIRAVAQATPADLARLQGQLGYALRAAGDFPRAAEALKASSSGGDPEGMALYAGLLLEGTPPVQLDRAEACRLFERAMDGGSVTGRAYFASCLHNGFGGVVRDERRGVDLYRQAAAGSREAMAVMSTLLRDGTGVPLDIAEAIKWAGRAVAAGDARADFVLGDIYDNGLGVAVDKAKAIEHYRRARAGLEAMAAAQILDARNVLGLLYRDGLGTGKDEARAAALYKATADLGNAAGMFRLADLYARGVGVPLDYARAFALLTGAIAREDTDAMQYMGHLNEEGRGVAQNYAEAMRWYRAAADRGHGEAMNNIASLHGGGRGVKANDAEALRWYRLAAERGNTSAMTSIGVFYDDGRGVRKDPAEANRWYRRAAEPGNAAAMNNLGLSYQDGTGVAANPAESLRWFLAAADKGNDDAMNNLGEAHRTGKAGRVDYPEAIKWFQRGIEKGNAHAMTTFGLMHEEGQGLPKNIAEAIRLYKAGAEKGNTVGMNNLAQIYEEGRGVPKNCREAEAWFKKAADGGHADAKAKIANGSLRRCR